MVTWQDERTLSEDDLDPDPHQQFRAWLRDAIEAGEPMANAMALGTSSPERGPAVRMILLEVVDARGFVFQTNVESPKARDLEVDPRAALTFFWPSLLRQVRVSGAIEALSRDESAALFAHTPPPIQAMYQACRQSQVIPNRAVLERSYAAALRSASSELPAHWGGYRLLVDAIEFWQGRQNWLQDRLRYARADGEPGWRIERLVP